MNSGLDKVTLEDLSPLQASITATRNGAVMVARFQGKYRHGSEGNGDGLFMAATIAAHFALLEPVCLVLDLRDLDYEWGNTILKAVNFFHEYGRDPDEKNKAVVIVATGTTHLSLEKLERTLGSGRRIYFNNLNEALVAAEREASAYLA